MPTTRDHCGTISRLVHWPSMGEL